jgi:hypothetical protein
MSDIKKHTHRPQNSTIAGATTLAGTILLIFGNVEIKDTFSTLKDMDWSQLLPLIFIIGGGLRSLLMKEKTKESLIDEIKAKKR